MYQAKEAGRNTVRFYDPLTQERLESRSEMERELRYALEYEEFKLHYQVQVNDDSFPIGAEALLRWNNRKLGNVSPAEFIPLAEKTGLIVSIGEWVLKTACAQIKQWESDALTRNLDLAINVSMRQFNEVDFVARTKAIIQESGINPTRLKLEITESMIMNNVQTIISTMNELKSLGVKFSMDDFGTGYSSLSYIKRLPLDQLKIDQSFVQDLQTNIHDRSIVRTIIAMALSLNLDIIAEGVETEEQRNILIDKGCRKFQGYFFSKPVPIEQLEVYLEKFRNT
jgi:EAL domain-containing protein (putative c-di-GMP-specific phosphodiesterase class I)